MARLTMVTMTIAFLSAFGWSCAGENSGTSGSEGDCTPGRSIECRCADGTAGTQTCQPDGTPGPCRCGPTSDAGSDLRDGSPEAGGSDDTGPASDGSDTGFEDARDSGDSGGDDCDSVRETIFNETAGEIRNVAKAPYNAQGDGQTDDTGAIRDAIADATNGDTIYFPEGTYMVSADDPANGGVAILLDRNNFASESPMNITLVGDCPDASILEMRGGHGTNGGNSQLFRIAPRDGWSGLKISNLGFDGNKAEQSDRTFVVQTYDSGSNSEDDILIEHCHAKNGYETSGINLHAGVTANRCTATNNDKHGFVLDSGDGAETPRQKVKNCYARGNGIYGIDSSGGTGLVEDCVVEENGLGAKVSSQDGGPTIWRRVRFKNNDKHGYTTAGADSYSVDVEFEDVISEGNDREGFRLGGRFNFIANGTIIARDNNQERGYGNVFLEDDASLDAGSATVQACKSRNGNGIDSRTDGNVDIGTYRHSGNSDGALGSTDNLNIDDQVERECGELENVPTADEVGWE